MSALILAAGRGGRLRPFTDSSPKPLLTILDCPLLALIIADLFQAGITRIGINASYLGSHIARFAHSVERQYPALKLDVRIEDQLSGPAGALRAFRDVVRSSDVTIVVSGDALIERDFAGLVERHVATGAIFSVVTKAMTRAGRFGVVDSEPGGRVVAWREKPEIDDAEMRSVSCGVYALAPKALDVLSTATVVDFGPDLAVPLLRRGGRITSIPARGYWTDIGSPDALLEANFAALRGEIDVGALRSIAAGGIARYRTEAVIPAVEQEPVFLGRLARLDPGSVVLGPTVIGSGSHVASLAHVERSLLLPGCRIAGGDVVIDRVRGPSG
ncbi:MAG: NDP-sugar synthase [Candidatus Nanopelagicales bacterium]